jgi:hypothetical protein
MVVPQTPVTALVTVVPSLVTVTALVTVTIKIKIRIRTKTTVPLLHPSVQLVAWSMVMK